MADYVYIDRQHQLDLAVSQLQGQARIGVDTESSGYYTYFSELCLIQVSGGGRNYVIDALANLQWEGLARIFADPAVTKIFHAAASDIVELKRAHDFQFRTVFDTMLACRMLGMDSCSLQSLVKNYVGIELAKKEQKSNWKRRPLTAAQLEYAHYDTVYLETLMEKMQAELEEFGLREELEYEFERVAVHTELQDTDRGLDEQAWVRAPGAFELSPIQRGALLELMKLRDRRARKENLASFRLASNEALVRIVRGKPNTLEELERLRALNPVFLKKDGPRMLEAFSAAREIGDDEIPLRPEQDPQTAGLFKRLKKWRGRIAEHRGIDPSMVVNNRGLQTIAESTPASVEELAALDLMNDWKLKKYGEQIVRIVEGKYDGRLPEDLARLPEERRNAGPDRKKGRGGEGSGKQRQVPTGALKPEPGGTG